MKKIVKLFLLTLISFTFYASFKPTSVNAVITPDNNGNWYWGYESKLNESYYSDLAGITNKEEFIETLAEILSSDKLEKIKSLLISIIGNYYQHGFEVVKTGKSCAIRIKVPIIVFR